MDWESYLIDDDGFYVVEFENKLEEEVPKKHIFAKSGFIHKDVYIQDDTEDNEDEVDDEYTLFGRYKEGHSKKCATIEVNRESTVNEVKNAFSKIIGKKIKGFSISSNPDEVITGDHIPLSSLPDITNGCFVDISL